MKFTFRLIISERRYTMKKSMIALFFASLAAAFECFAAPTTVKVTSFTQADDRTITIDYTLAGDPAVITLDIQTNASSWASIGGRDLCRAQGDVWKRVDAQSGRITYRPGGDEAYPVFASGDVRAVLKAYPTNDPPAYMVVDLTQNSSKRVRFYPSEDFVPGGVLANTDYRVSKLLMRKIPAAGVTWTMGSVSEGGGADETAHPVCLADNYYIACFEFTQAQAQLVSGQTPAKLSNFTIEGSMRPCDMLSYYKIRENVYNQAIDAEDPDYQYPNSPHPTSYLGLLRTRSENLVDFDLPSEAQWEYACRAGTGEGVWNTGKPISSAADLPGRYNDNGGKGSAKYDGGWKISAVGPTNGIATVGSYMKNAWGLYDMHGNVYEWCLDLYTADITMLNGEVNVQPGTLADGKTAGKNRVRRSGYFLSVAADCRSAKRSYTVPNAYSGSWTGFRPAAPAVAK
jgi:formylglycine-generating enzyme required for sulfatase activity